jgi:hypothetical protein
MRIVAILSAASLLAGCGATDPQPVSSTVSLSANTIPVGGAVQATVSIVNAGTDDVTVTDVSNRCASAPLRIFDTAFRQLAVAGYYEGICELGSFPGKVLHPGEAVAAVISWKAVIYDARVSQTRALPPGQYFLATNVFRDGILEIQTNFASLKVVK